MRDDRLVNLAAHADYVDDTHAAEMLRYIEHHGSLAMTDGVAKRVEAYAMRHPAPDPDTAYDIIRMIRRSPRVGATPSATFPSAPNRDASA